MFGGRAKLLSNVVLTNNVLSGKIEVDNNSEVKNSKLQGEIIISQDTQINDSQLEGKILFGEKAIVNKSRIAGQFSVGQSAYITNACVVGKVTVGDNLKIFGTVTLNGNIEIGNYTSLNGPNMDIHSNVNKVKIGSFCSIARNVTIQEYNHKINRVSSYFMSPHIFGESWLNDINSKGDIIIENDVWIGTQCVVLSGAHISTGAVIAANSVITSYIPPYAIVGGSPTRILKYRFSEQEIKQLLELKWWEWDIEKIKRNKDFFLSEFLEMTKIVD